MPITKRTLTKWRREALTKHVYVTSDDNRPYEVTIAELHGRILRMTQELLDQHLLTKG